MSESLRTDIMSSNTGLGPAQCPTRMQGASTGARRRERVGSARSSADLEVTYEAIPEADGQQHALRRDLAGPAGPAGLLRRLDHPGRDERGSGALVVTGSGADPEAGAVPVDHGVAGPCGGLHDGVEGEAGIKRCPQVVVEHIGDQEVGQQAGRVGMPDVPPALEGCFEPAELVLDVIALQQRVGLVVDGKPSGAVARPDQCRMLPAAGDEPDLGVIAAARRGPPRTSNRRARAAAIPSAVVTRSVATSSRPSPTAAMRSASSPTTRHPATRSTSPPSSSTPTSTTRTASTPPCGRPSPNGRLRLRDPLRPARPRPNPLQRRLTRRATVTPTEGPLRGPALVLAHSAIGRGRSVHCNGTAIGRSRTSSTGRPTTPERRSGLRFRVEPGRGIEPRTYSLRVNRSAD